MLIRKRKQQAVPGRGEHAGQGGFHLRKERARAEFKPGEVLGTEIRTVKKGIALPDWENVRGALYLYTSGQIEAAKDTSVEVGSAIRQAHGSDATSLLSAFIETFPPSPVIVDRMLADAKTRVDRNGWWDHRFEYFAPSALVFTTVEIEKAPRGDMDHKYILGFLAMDGRGPEADLAAALKTIQVVRSQGVSVTFAPVEGISGDYIFDINMDAVADSLAGVIKKGRRLKRKAVTGTEMADHFMRRRRGSPTESDIVLGEKDGFRVSLGFGNVGNHIDYAVDREKELWGRVGNRLHGPLGRDYSTDGGYADPAIVITVVDARSGDSSYNRTPVIDPKRQAAMAALTREIAGVFVPKAE